MGSVIGKRRFPAHRRAHAPRAATPSAPRPNGGGFVHGATRRRATQRRLGRIAGRPSRSAMCRWRSKGACSIPECDGRSIGPPAVRWQTKGGCSIPGCARPAKARTWCAAHWLRWRKHGDPTAFVRAQWTPAEDAAILAARPTPHTERRAAVSGQTEIARVAKQLGKPYAAVVARRGTLARKARRCI